MSARKPLIVFAIVALILVAVFVVVKPDRNACVAAMGREMDTAIASGQSAEAVDGSAARSRLRWPCRFQSDQDLEQIGKEVIASRMPEVLTKALGDALESMAPR